MSDAPAERPLVHLQQPGDLPALQAFILALEARQGWDREDMRTCLLHMGEELGEVYEAARRWQAAPVDRRAERQAALGHELVDVLNYLLAVANRADIDLQAAFIEKNARNQTRVWPAP
jgi:NTP pyrophosphatase (non-canonical NTP hydrolase)